MFEWLHNLNRDKHYLECAKICEMVAYTRKNCHFLGAELNAMACCHEILKKIDKDLK